MTLDAETRLVALLGDPVAHSRSPRIHNAAFRAQGLNFIYAALPVTADDLPAALAGLKALHFVGANVTIPHKEAVLPHLDAVTPQAEAVGAVNTLVVEQTDGTTRLVGDNTDVMGFLEPLAPFAGRLHGAEVVIFGAGGGARAAVYALLTTMRPACLTLAVRRPEQAARLASDLADHDATGALRILPLTQAAEAVRAAALVVNATPLGMHPATDATPWPYADDFSPDHLVYDLIYRPETTRLLHDAQAQGARTIGGLAMLVEQAAAAYRQWTGREMPREVVWQALRGEQRVSTSAQPRH